MKRHLVFVVTMDRELNLFSIASEKIGRVKGKKSR